MQLINALKNKYYKFRVKSSRQTGAVVLLYHRVFNYTTDPQLLSVKPDNFVKHIQYLKENFNILSIEEFDFIIKRKEGFPPNSVLITFDDGYADNLYNAAPILEKYNAQGLFYIATGNINKSKEFWWDALERIIMLSDLKEKVELELNDHLTLNEIVTPENKEAFYIRMINLLRDKPSNEREGIINFLSDRFNATPDRSSYYSLKAKELAEFSKYSSVVIGAHTVTHTKLSILSPEDQRQEIVNSKKQLEDWLGTKIKYFSYPFGTYSDYNKVTVEICKEAGFKWVASNFPGVVTNFSSVYEMPRNLVRDWDIEEFKLQLNSFFK